MNQGGMDTIDTYIQLGVYICGFVGIRALLRLQLPVGIRALCPPAMTRNVFAYDLEGKLVRDHLFIDIFSWNQCPPAISHLCISYDIVSVMIVSLFFRVKPATGNLLLSGSMWVHVGSVMHCKWVSIVVTWL